MGLLDLFKDKGGDVVGMVTKKFGIDGGQAKAALDKIIPFVQSKLGGSKKAADKAKSADLKGLVGDPAKMGSKEADQAGGELLADIDPGERERHLEEVARETGLDKETVRQMMPAATAATVGAMDAAGFFAHFQGVHDKMMQHLDDIKRDQADGKLDGLIDGKPYDKKF